VVIKAGEAAFVLGDKQGLKAAVALAWHLNALTASPAIGPVTNWSISSFDIFGSAALWAAMAAFCNFVLLGINGPVGHVYA